MLRYKLSIHYIPKYDNTEFPKKNDKLLVIELITWQSIKQILLQNASLVLVYMNNQMDYHHSYSQQKYKSGEQKIL